MAEATVATDVHEALDIQRGLRPKAPLNLVIVLNHIPKLIDLFSCDIIHPSSPVNTGRFTNGLGAGATNSKYVSQRNGNWFVRKVNSCNASHVSLLSLPLLVFGIAADYPHDPSATDHFALVAHGFDADTYLHNTPSYRYGEKRIAWNPLFSRSKP